jgi:hypothetical protein
LDAFLGPVDGVVVEVVLRARERWVLGVELRYVAPAVVVVGYVRGVAAEDLPVDLVCAYMSVARHRRNRRREDSPRSSLNKIMVLMMP